MILTSNLYYPNVGGIENSLHSLASIAKMYDEEVVVITSNIYHNQNNLESGDSFVQGVNVTRYETYPLGTKFKALKHILSAISCYRKEYIKSGDATVIARYHWNVIFAYLAGFRDIRYLIPGVVANRQSKESKLIKIVEVAMQKIAFKLASRLFVFSSNMYTQVKENTKDEITKVNPGIDGNRFKYVSGCIEKNKVELLIVARLVPVKGVDYAIKSLSYLPESYILNIVGYGPEEDNLKQLASDINVTHRVNFIGKSNTPEKYYAESDAFLLPSLYEPFGQTILEASASGLPVVAFKNDVKTATAEILGENAFFSNELTASSYANAVQTAIDYKKENSDFSENMRRRILEEYSWEKLYRDLLC